VSSQSGSGLELVIECERERTNSLFGLIKRITSSHVFTRWVSGLAFACAVVVVLCGALSDLEGDGLPTLKWLETNSLNLVQFVHVSNLWVENLQHGLTVHDAGGLLVLSLTAQVAQ